LITYIFHYTLKIVLQIMIYLTLKLLQVFIN